MFWMSGNQISASLCFSWMDFGSVFSRLNLNAQVCVCVCATVHWRYILSSSMDPPIHWGHAAHYAAEFTAEKSRPLLVKSGKCKISMDSHIVHRGGKQAGKIRLKHQWICLLRLKSRLDLEIQILSANLILPPYKPFWLFYMLACPTF